MGNISSAFYQCYRIPSPPLTEKNLTDQTGKVHIVTGGYVGVGKELVKILYQHNATVYCAGRDKAKGDRAIRDILSQLPDSKGRLEYLHLDLADLSTIKKSADDFLARESRLDVLTNNAGVMIPPKGSKDVHGHELQMGTNCLGPFLFTRLLTPLLQRTAAASPPGTVRVTWASSLAVMNAPRGAVAFDEATGAPTVSGQQWLNYAVSKVGNTLLAMEYARQHGRDGIIAAAFNPGNLRTELARHGWQVGVKIAGYLLLWPAVYGAYTELYAGWSPEITAAKNGCHVVPWGQDGMPFLRGDILAAMRPKSEGGTGQGERFWAYCENETHQYA